MKSCDPSMSAWSCPHPSVSLQTPPGEALHCHVGHNFEIPDALCSSSLGSQICHLRPWGHSGIRKFHSPLEVRR